MSEPSYDLLFVCGILVLNTLYVTHIQIGLSNGNVY